MRHHGHAGGEADPGGLGGVDDVDGGTEGAGALADGVEQLLVAHLSMEVKRGGMGRAISDLAAMGRQITPIGQGDELVFR